MNQKPDYPAISIIYVMLGLLVVVTVSYLAFALLGRSMPDIAWVTTLLTQCLLLVVKDKYDKDQAQRKLARPRLNLLLIEDNVFQQTLIKKGLFEQQFPADLLIASSVEESMEMLAQAAPYNFFPKPDCIILDLVFKTERQGTDFLEWKMSKSELMDIPVVIITGHERSEFQQHEDLLNTCCRFVQKGMFSVLVKAIQQCTNIEEISPGFCVAPKVLKIEDKDQ